MNRCHVVTERAPCRHIAQRCRLGQKSLATQRACVAGAVPARTAPASSDADTAAPSRRVALAAACAMVWQMRPAAAMADAGAAPAADGTPPTSPASSAPASAVSATAEYASPAQGFRLRVPAAWEQKEKAGADVLFEDPSARSTSVGVTVSRVRVKSIQDFGSLEEVGVKLLAAEKAKESTLSVELLRSASHQAGSGPGGALLYDYEYELDSTRGRNCILNTVTIQDAKLYILNGMSKCTADGGCDAQALQLLRDAAASLTITE